jgi:BASS family bile acid:Na+ symporter
VSSSFGLPENLRFGILLIAACPVGDMANFFTLLGKGNLAMSVTMNAISCLLSPLSMVFAFALYGKALGSPFVFSVPSWSLVLRLFLLITVPILTGMGLRAGRVALASKLRW